MCCCDCCCCCLKNEKEVAISGIVLNALAVIFLIWGVADMFWSKNGARALYIVAFVFLILTLLGFIAILILIIVRKEENQKIFNQISKYINIAILVLLILSLLFLIISELIIIIDYAKAENTLNNYYYGANLPTRWWITATIPGLISIILISVLLCAASKLGKIFYDITKNDNPVPNNVANIDSKVNFNINNPPNQMNTQQNPLNQINQMNNQINPINNQINPMNNHVVNNQMNLGPPNMITTNTPNGVYQA